MKAMVLTAVGKLEIQELDIAPPVKDEVVIDVAACGVCGTDLHMYHGDKGAFDNDFPLVMGHEFAGVVSAVGPQVKKLAVGDRVCVDPNMYCGWCDPCLAGTPHYCENMVGYGTNHYGGFAQQCKVTERAAYKIPDSLNLEHAAMVEPVACCLHGIDRSGIRPGDTVGVIGAGSIGLMMLQLALVAGAARVVVIEPVEEKRRMAKDMGACLTLDPMNCDVKAELAKAGIKLNSVIECVGRVETMEQAVDIAANCGTVMLFGLTPPESKMTVLPFEQLFQKEISVTGSFINPLVGQRVIDLLAAGRMDLDAIITDKVPMAEAEQVFSDPAWRKRGKVLIVP